MNEVRILKIESYGKAYDYLVASLKQFPDEMWKFQPSPDAWSIHEIIVHIADSEANSYVRCRRAIAEPGLTVMAYNEMRWAEALDYLGQSTVQALECFRWLRWQTYHLIRSQPESVWSHAYSHPELGVITLEDWLDIYERHIPEHVEQMQSVYEVWIGTKGGKG
jgi:hypothetical protein